MPTRTQQPGTVDRSAALAARPYPLPVVASKQVANDELQLTIEYERPRWQQWMGAPPYSQRSFVLDKMGRQVYEQCDGETSVGEIIEAIQEEYQVSRAEAEVSTANYLKTLMGKGLVAMEIDREKQ